jgi:hypothetical protein
MSRLTRIQTRLRFGDGVHLFYLEYRCENTVKCGEVCEACSMQYEDCRTQYSRRFMHGLVSGPYGKRSRIYGSPWYMEAVKKYGEPPAEYIRAAIDARDLVYASLPEHLVKALEHNTSMPPKKRKIVVLNRMPTAPVPVAPAAPAPVSPKKVEKKKRKEVRPEPPITMPERFQAITASAVENAVPPKDVCEVIHTEWIKKEVDGEMRYMIKTENGYIVYSDYPRKFIGHLAAEEVDGDE